MILQSLMSIIFQVKGEDDSDLLYGWFDGACLSKYLFLFVLLHLQSRTTAAEPESKMSRDDDLPRR